MLRQVFFTNPQHALNVLGVFGGHRHKFGKGVAQLHFLQPRRNIGTAVHLIELICNEQGGHLFAQQSQHLGIGLVEHAGLDHEQNQVYIAHRTHYGFVQRAIECVVMTGLKPGRIDKDKLRCAARVHTGNAVARGLRFARGDTDFLPYQGVH